MVYFGLASKAGKIVSGSDAVEEMAYKQKIFLIIIAEDASLKTKERFLRIAKEKEIQFFIYGNIADNSRAIGNKNKAIIAVKDRNFCRAICQILIGGDTIGQN